MSFFNKLIAKIRIIYIGFKRKQLKNRSFSLIANNCVGAQLLSELGMQFNSPFVNLWLWPEEYVRLLGSLEKYMNTPMRFIKEEDISYPIGILDDVRIYFMHYTSEQEALEAWNRRVARLNWDNLYVIMQDTDGCKLDNINAFLELTYNKRFIAKDISDLGKMREILNFSCFHTDRWMDLFCFNSCLSIRKRIWKYDFVEWFNEG